jgi:nucleoside-diphosphate kinase
MGGRNPLQEKTLLIVKPDATGRHLTGRILARVEEEGFRLTGLAMLRLTTPRAESFYGVHRERPFFRDLVTYMCSGPVVVVGLERENAIKELRLVVGATDPAKADAGTLRALYGRDVQNNAVHASDSPENGVREVGFFFDASPKG